MGSLKPIKFSRLESFLHIMNLGIHVILLAIVSNDALGKHYLVDTGHEHREGITTARHSDNDSLVKTKENTDKKKSEDYFLGLLSKIKGKLKRRRGCGGKGCGQFNAGGNAFGQIGGSASGQVNAGGNAFGQIGGSANGGVNAGGQGQLGGRFNAGIQGQSQFSGGV